MLVADQRVKVDEIAFRIEAHGHALRLRTRNTLLEIVESPEREVTVVSHPPVARRIGPSGDVDHIDPADFVALTDQLLECIVIGGHVEELPGSSYGVIT